MAFDKVKKDTENKVLVGLMQEIENDSELTQRGLSQRLGVALGLTNQYLKHVITKGWVRVSQVAPRRIAYFLTPQGFQEKSRMVSGYLKNSLTMYREARVECEMLAKDFCAAGWNKIAVVGKGDIADIAMLVLKSEGLQPEHNTIESDFSTVKVILVADMEHPQQTYEDLRARAPKANIICIKLLQIREKK